MKIIENNNVIIAIMENTTWDAVDFLKANFPQALTSDKKLSYSDKYNACKMKDKYIGIAKCSPEDEFDREYGIRLAKARAKMKHDSAMQKRVNDRLNHTIAEMTIAMNKMTMKWVNTSSKLKNL